MIIHVPVVIKTRGDAVRCESLGVCQGQSTVIGRVLCVGITGNSMCLAAYHWQKDFSIGWKWLAMPRQCFSSGTAADGRTPPPPVQRPSQSLPKITTDDYVHQIFITSCMWFRRGVLCDGGLRDSCAHWLICFKSNLYSKVVPLIISYDTKSTFIRWWRHHQMVTAVPSGLLYNWMLSVVQFSAISIVLLLDFVSFFEEVDGGKYWQHNTNYK